MSRISIIVPVLNDAESLRLQQPFFDAARTRGHEVIVVDGGSCDRSLDLASTIGAQVVSSERGRAPQMNAGAEAAGGQLLLFLHADTRIDVQALEQLWAERERRGDSLWGRFDVRLNGEHWLYRVIETMMNLRSRFTAIATGDQAMFVSRALFERVGGFPRIALMEDVALSKQLRKLAPPLCLKARALTSTRRWDENGIIATVLLMWRLRLGYFLGVDPARLAQIYYRTEINSRR